MEVAFPASGLLQIGRGDEDLRDDVVVLGEELVVDVHELALADSGGCLLGRHVGRLRGQA